MQDEMRCFGMVLMLPLSLLIQDRMNIQNEMEANTRDDADTQYMQHSSKMRITFSQIHKTHPAFLFEWFF